MQKCRIVIDTNLWISFLLTKKFDFIDKLLYNSNTVLIFSAELIAELIEVTDRPKLSKFFTADELKLVFEIIEYHAIFIPVISYVNLCRDSKDNFLLSLAKDSKADYLITGDKDLLVLKTFEETKILTISEFQTIINQH